MLQYTINQLFTESNRNGDDNTFIFIGLILFSAAALHFAAFLSLRLLSGKFNKKLVRDLHDKYKIPSLVFILVLAINFIFLGFTPKEEFTSLKKILNVAIIFTISWLMIRTIQLGRDTVLRRYDISEKDNLKARRVYTQFRIIERILITVIIIIALAAALMNFESIRKLGISLFASAGVAGIILGLAAQKMIGTVIAGFQIAVTQPIRLEDAVVVEGEWGWIEEINLTYVVIRIWDKRRLVLPTTYFIEKPFQNWTRNSADILGTVFLYTDYNVPFDKLREELTRLLKNTPLWDGKVNVLQVTDTTEKTVEIRVLVSAENSPTAWDLRVHIREKLVEFLQLNYPDSLPRARFEVKPPTEGKS